MPVSIVDVQINDQAFKDFYALFARFRAEAAETPKEWSKVSSNARKAFSPGSKASGTATAGETSGIDFGDLVAAMAAQAAMLAKVEKSEKNSSDLVEKQSKSWKGIVGYTKQVSSNLFAATKSLLQWSALTGAVTGLVGAGGLFGLDRLARDVSSSRRSAFGLNATYGEQKAFETDYGRFVDPNAFLSGVNSALHDVSQRWVLSAAGLTAKEQSGDTAEVGSALLSRLKEIADKTDPSMFAQTLQARGLDRLVTVNDLERLRNMSSGEFSAQRAAYGRDSKSFDLDAEVAMKWANFATQLDRSWLKIENALIDGLTPLAGAFDKLSVAAADVVTAFLKNPDIKKDIADLGKNVEDFAKYVGSKEFSDDVKSFAGDVHSLSKAIIDGLHALGKTSVAEVGTAAMIGFATGGPVGAVVIGGLDYELQKGVDKDAPKNDWTRKPDGSTPFSWFNPGTYLPGAHAPGTAPWDGAAGPTGAKGPPAKRTSAANDDVPLLELIRRLEASGDTAISKPYGGGHGGAVGRYQIMPAQARALGFDPSRLTDPAYSRQVAMATLGDLHKQGAKTLAEYLVGYNSTPKYLQKFIASGDDSRVLLPETRKYLERAKKIIGGDPAEVRVGDAGSKDVARAVEKVAAAVSRVPASRVTITVVNNTGAAVSTSAVAAAGSS